MSDEKTSLTAALRHLAEQERRTPSEHATPGELTAYHEGTLPPPIEARVREHLAHCKLCSDLLLDLAGFADLAPPPGVPELTDAEVEGDWQALRARMGAAADEPRELKPLGEVVPIRRSSAPVRPDREFSPWKVLAAAALAATIGLSGWVLQLKQEVREGRRLSESLVGAPVYYVADGVNRGGQEEDQSVAAQQPFIQSLQIRQEYLGFPEYSVVVLRDKEVILRKSLLKLGRELVLPFPQGLPEGDYKALLQGIENGQAKPLAEFRFRVRGS